MKKSALVIVSCIVVNMLLGMAWYGVFSQPWMDGNMLTLQKIEANANATPGYILSMIVAAVSAMLFTLIFRRMGIRNWIEGFSTGAAIGLIALLGTAVGNWFAMRPLALSFIDGGFAFIQYIAFGAIIGAVHGKDRQS